MEMIGTWKLGGLMDQHGQAEEQLGSDKFESIANILNEDYPDIGWVINEQLLLDFESEESAN